MQTARQDEKFSWSLIPSKLDLEPARHHTMIHETPISCQLSQHRQNYFLLFGALSQKITKKDTFGNTTRSNLLNRLTP